MIKNVKVNPDKLKINVFTKNGEEFLGRDLSEDYLSADHKLLSFFDEEVLVVYPINNIDYFEPYEDKED